MSHTTSTEANGETTLRLLMLAAVFAIPVVIVLQPVIDWDLWWHLRVGEWVLQHGRVPTNDPFSSNGGQQPWLAYSWLFGVLVYLCFHSLGLTGVMLFTLALSLLNSLLLYRFIARRLPSFLKSTALTGLALLALVMLFRPRPWQFSILFSLCTLDTVLTLREGKRSWAVWLLPIAYALWANLHIQLIYGLLLLVLAILAPFLDNRLGWEGGAGPMKPLSPSWERLLLVSILCGLATLLNPYHARLYGVMWEYATQPGPYEFVAELTAPSFRRPSDWALLLLAGLAVFALGRRQGWGSFELLLLAGSVVLAFRARRDLWLLVLSASAVLVSVRGTSEERAVTDRFHWSWLRGAVLIGLETILIACLWWARELTEKRQWQAVAQTFPVKAASLVRDRGYPGPLFNDFDWGGFLIWDLRDRDLPVAIDGRTNLHGDKRLARFSRVWAGLPGMRDENGGIETGWANDPDLAASGVVIARRQSALAELLARDPQRFEEVPTDDPVARIFIKRRRG